MERFIGTWKSAGSIDKNGEPLENKLPIKFIFNEDGSGVMKFLLLSKKYTWELSGEDAIKVHASEDSLMTLKGDTLYMEADFKGDQSLFKKA